MESQLKCQACRSRVRPTDEWCTICYARLAVPAPPVPQPAVLTSQAAAVAVADPDLGPDLDPGLEPKAGTARPRGRRVRPEEVDQLAEAMLSQLAAAQPAVSLPGPVGRAFAAVGLGPADTGGRKAVGIAVICAGTVGLLTAASWVAGLML